MDFHFQVQKCPGQLLELKFKKVTLHLLNGSVLSGWVYSVDILNNCIGITIFQPDPERNMLVDRTRVHAFTIKDIVIEGDDFREFLALAMNFPGQDQELEEILALHNIYQV